MIYKNIILSLFFILALAATVSADRPSNWLSFSWDAVTQNVDGTEGSDIDGYAIYRSREPEAWSFLTGKEKAFNIIPADQTGVSCWCDEPGAWFFIVRVFNTDNFFSNESNVVECFIDPAQIGDLDHDGDVDGADLAIMAQSFGRD